MRSEQPGFLLLGDVPSKYQSDPFPEDRVRGKFFRGFLAGAVLSALAIAALFFVYGRHINDAVARLAGTAGTKPATERVQAPATQTVTPATPLSPVASEAIPPSISSADPQAATDTTPIDTTATPAANPGSQQPPAADPGAVLPAAQGAVGQASEPTKPISSASKTPASRNRAPVEASDDTGQNDLAIAQRYLRNGGQAADSAAAALLWSAVEKGSVAAEVTLAELYARGEGVARSCDQARVLLYAAAAEGSDEADQQLAQIARGGCR